MYQVTIFNNKENTIIHYSVPEQDAPHLTKMNMTLGENKVNTFIFVIEINHPHYNDITEFITKVQVLDIKNNKEKFSGRVLDVVPEMDAQGHFFKTVTCESELGYLNDSIVGRWELHPSDLPSDAPSYAEPNYDTRKTLQKIIDNHNANVEDSKKFILRNVDVVESEYIQTSYESSLDIILNKVVSGKNIVVKVEVMNGVRYIDFLQDNAPVSPTKVILRKNLNSFKKKPDFETFCTRLVAIGTDGLTFEDINNGKNYVENQDAIEQYGIISKSFEWKDVTVKENLLRKANDKLSSILSNITDSVEVSALDLFCIGLTPEEFNVSTKYEVLNDMQSFDEVLKVVQINLDLLQPWESQLTFSSLPATASSSVTSMKEEVNGNRLEVLTYNGRLIQKMTSMDGEFSTYREQTDKKISERVTSTDFESYKEQTAEEISQMVTKDNFGSEITQHSDEIKMSVGVVGVTNLIKNSNFKLDFSSWWFYGAESGGSWYLGPMLDGKYRGFYPTTQYKGTAIYQSIHNSNRLTMNKNTNYYFSCVLRAESSTKGASCGIEIWNNRNAVNYIDFGGVDPDGRKLIQCKFSIPNDFDEIKFKVNHYGVTDYNGAYVVFTGDLMLTPGDNYIPWCPSPDEVSSVDVKISEDGLEVYNGNISIKNKNGQEVLKGDTNGNLNILGDFTIGGEGGNVAYHTKDCSKWSKPNGNYAIMDANGARINNGGGERPIKSLDYGVVRPGIKNGSTTTIVLPPDFQGMGINEDFTVICSYGNIDSSAWAQQNKDAVRTIFVNLLSWNRDTRELVVQPCLQKIGIETKTMWGWDANTTTPGNTVGEGAIDVIVVARI